MSRGKYGHPPECMISSLPNELLLAIFHLGITTRDQLHNGKEAFPIRVSHVCQRWRALAVNSPTLWTTICFNAINYPLPYIALYEARSMPLPLLLHFQFAAGELSSKQISCASRLALRTSELVIRFHDDIALPTLLPLFENAPHLRSLQYSAALNANEPHPTTPERMMNFPALQFLKVIKGCLSCLTPPSSVTSLYISNASIDDSRLRAIVQECPLLETLALLHYMPTSLSDQSPVESPRIKRFAIKLAGPLVDGLKSVALSFPRLEYLELMDEHTRLVLRELFPSLPPSLHTLHLRGDIDMDALLPFMYTCRGIRRLILSNVAFGPLIPSMDAWPKLESIDVDDRVKNSVDFTYDDSEALARLADLTRQRQDARPAFRTTVYNKRWRHEYPIFCAWEPSTPMLL
ncbi:hypothetical protein BD626DRAFT_632701 [Schizophyllum amplum]|uniref:F-box domain-containing protein n=1 Tax=Schizophyllum amplum TaxID=97359 RepID=A0A550C674_9AGAR|nr:hypothetical protein BD626DRAFT_632701 [Auriculariopsis ampla]